ncbi:hypothetical protein [Hafnia phage TS33]|nr:hypothetical protein [Hafnia phage TS33]
MGIKVNLKNVRIGWVNVFEKAKDSTNDKGDVVKGKFQLTCYLDKNDPQITRLDSAILAELTEKLKSEKAAEKWMDRNYGFGNHADKCCVRDLEERDKPIEGLEEGLYFKATSHKRPVIMTSLGEKQIERGLTLDGDDIEGQEVYAGCYANVSVEFYWYDNYKTLLANILGVRFRKDGDAFGGAGETADDNDLNDDDEDDKPSRSKQEKPSRRRNRDEDEEEDDEEPKDPPRRRRNRD